MSLATHHSRAAVPSPTLAWQQQFVASIKAELARTCFLLTNDPERARHLAVDALLELFRTSLDWIDDPDQERIQLLIYAGRRYLEDYQEGKGTPDPLSVTAEPPRAPVDDERQRVPAALGRLEAADQVLLVLRAYNGLDEEAAASALAEAPDALHDRLKPIQKWLRNAVDAHRDVSIRSLLSNAASNVPPPQLWSLVEGPLREDIRQQEARAKRLTFTIVVGMIVLLTVGVVWLVGFSWLMGSGEASEIAGVATSTPETNPTATTLPAPEPTSTSPPGLPSLDIPQANIPSTIVLHARNYPTLNRPGTDELQRATYSYDIVDNQLTERSQDQPIPTVISVDGRRGLSLEWRSDEGALASIELIRLLDVSSGEVQWTKTFDEDERISQVGFAGQWVYAFDRVSPSRLILYDIEDGREVARRENFTEDLWTFDGHQPTERPQFFASPDGRQLWVNLRGSWPWLRQGMS